MSDFNYLNSKYAHSSPEDEEHSLLHPTSPHAGEEKPQSRYSLKHRAFVIAVANQKGGVAKTTTVASLGGALAHHQHEVLLVDLDAQANLTLALGKDPTRVRGTITEVLFNNATLLSVSRETDIPGLDLVPASADMELAERFLPKRKEYETILKRSMNGVEDPVHASEPGKYPARHSLLAQGRLSELYDYVILDCPPFTGAVTLNALAAADLLIIPTQPEFFSAHALRTMMHLVRVVRETHNPKLTYRILITMYDQRNRIHRNICAQIRATFGQGVFETQISTDTKLRESAVEGVPITHYKASSRSSQQYAQLAEEIIAYVNRLNRVRGAG